MSIPAVLLAASASGLALISPTSAADPAPQPGDPNTASCASLSKVQPAIDDLRDKTNAYLANPNQPDAEAPKNPAGATTSAPPAPTKVQSIVDSLRHISGELKQAEPTVKDTSLHGSTDKLATTVGEAADSVSQMASPQANGLNPLKLSALGVNITSAIIFYQINYTRVCGQTPADQQAPPTTSSVPAKPTTSAAPAKPTTSAAPAKPATSKPAAPQQTLSPTPKKTS